MRDRERVGVWVLVEVNVGEGVGVPVSVVDGVTVGEVDLVADGVGDAVGV